MDLDVIQRHVTGLLELKSRLESMLTGAESSVAAALGTVVDDLKNKFAAEIEEITGIGSKLADHISAFDSFKTTIESDTAAVRTEIEAKLAPFSEIVDWFTANKQALETLLSLGDSLVPVSSIAAPASAASTTTTVGTTSATPARDVATATGTTVQEPATPAEAPIVTQPPAAVEPPAAAPAEAPVPEAPAVPIEPPAPAAQATEPPVAATPSA